MHNTARLATLSCKKVDNNLGTSEGNILDVHRLDGFVILI
jgi:hypothetical protein